jgi:hypothetical protein
MLVIVVDGMSAAVCWELATDITRQDWMTLCEKGHQANRPGLAAIPSITDTAGGKTEAAFFPVLSRMLAEGWTGLSVLYMCPIKALLNNLDGRLQRYCAFSRITRSDARVIDY